MVQGLSEYFIATNKAVHKGRFFGELKFDPSHTGNVGFTFSASDILQDTISISHQVSSSNDITIGGVFLGCLKLTFLPSVTSTRTASGYWTQGMISLYYEEETGHGESESGLLGWESVKVGDYYIKDAVFNGLFLDITAYDGMCLFDIKVEEELGGKFYDMISRAVGRAQSLFDISLQLGIPDRELFEMVYPNANMVFSIYVENDIVTYRDLLYWIGVSVGGFFWVDRDGYLRCFSYHPDWALKEDPDCIVDYDERVAKTSQIYDFETSWDGILIDDLVEGVTIMDNNGATEKLMSLGAIPFFQNLTAQQKSDFKIDLGYVVKNDLVVRPFKAQLRSAPIYDVGDMIGLRNGDFGPWEDAYGNVLSIIHSWTFTKNTLTLKAYGSRRSTVYTSRSGGTSGGSTGVIGSVDKVSYFHDTNNQVIALDTLDDMVELASIDFYANQATQIDCMAQLNPIQSGISTAQYYWELDGLQTYSATSMNTDEHTNRPIETLVTLDEVETSGLHTMKLKAKLTLQDDPSATFRYPAGAVRVYLKGQGLEHKSVWNGVISLDDELPRLQQDNNIVPYDEDTITFTNPTVDKATLSDTQPPIGAALFNLELSDDGVTVTVEEP